MPPIEVLLAPPAVSPSFQDQIQVLSAWEQKQPFLATSVSTFLWTHTPSFAALLLSFLSASSSPLSLLPITFTFPVKFLSQTNFRSKTQIRGLLPTSLKSTEDLSLVVVRKSHGSYGERGQGGTSGFPGSSGIGGMSGRYGNPNGEHGTDGTDGRDAENGTDLTPVSPHPVRRLSRRTRHSCSCRCLAARGSTWSNHCRNSRS